MPHAILRALRHRSTPTLLPSTSTSTQELPAYTLSVPSIFITVPDEEGAHHWCALAGTAAPSQNPRAAGHSTMDPPLPDFAALEETISKLKRAGETPTFRRPGRKDDGVVLPKKKYGSGQGVSHQKYMYDQHQHTTQPGNGKRPRPKRPQTSPIARREQFRMENENTGQDYFGASVSDVQMLADPAESPSTEPQSGRFTPTKVLRSLSKKTTRRPPPVFTSISYESVVPQPFSAPAEGDSFASARNMQDQTPKRKRSSLGWLFSKRSSVVVPEEGSEARISSHSATAHPIVEQSEEYYTTTAYVDADMEEPMSPAETHESDLDKPLPPIPATLAQSSYEVSVSETINQVASTTDSTISDLSAAELQINDSVQVQVIISSNDQYAPVELPSAGLQPPSESSRTMEKDKKIKRKFSLKRLRERFLSTAGQDVPPMPPVPVPALPTTMPTFQIDPPFTPPSMSEAIFPVSASSDSAPNKTSSSLEETVVPEIPTPRVTLDGESTSSEDSSAISSPDSTPPETPDAVSIGQVFELFQSGDAKLEAQEYGSKVEVGIVEPVGNGITRSTGMRQLNSLRFAEMSF